MPRTRKRARGHLSFSKWKAACTLSWLPEGESPAIEFGRAFKDYLHLTLQDRIREWEYPTHRTMQSAPNKLKFKHVREQADAWHARFTKSLLAGERLWVNESVTASWDDILRADLPPAEALLRTHLHPLRGHYPDGLSCRPDLWVPDCATLHSFRTITADSAAEVLTELHHRHIFASIAFQSLVCMASGRAMPPLAHKATFFIKKTYAVPPITITFRTAPADPEVEGDNLHAMHNSYHEKATRDIGAIANTATFLPYPPTPRDSGATPLDIPYGFHVNSKPQK